MEGALSPWADELSRRVGAVLTSLPGQPPALEGTVGLLAADSHPPTWLLLPIWLEEAWGKPGAGSLPEEVMRDLLWGQYSLFLCIRIQDDLLDRQRHDLRFLLVADRFLLESLEAFQRLPALNGEFWTLYRNCLRQTVDGILEVGRLEATPGAFTAQHLELHARVSAIFKLGVAALCSLHRRPEEMAWLSNLLDRLAVFGQLCDDLRDLSQDLENSRYTWVGNALPGAGRGNPILSEPYAGFVGEFMQPDWAEPVLAELRGVAREAAAWVPASAPPAVHDLVGKLREKPDVLEQLLHETRVRALLGEIVGD